MSAPPQHQEARTSALCTPVCQCARARESVWSDAWVRVIFPRVRARGQGRVCGFLGTCVWLLPPDVLPGGLWGVVVQILEVIMELRWQHMRPACECV